MHSAGERLVNVAQAAEPSLSTENNGDLALVGVRNGVGFQKVSQRKSARETRLGIGDGQRCKMMYGEIGQTKKCTRPGLFVYLWNGSDYFVPGCRSGVLKLHVVCRSSKQGSGV